MTLLELFLSFLQIGLFSIGATAGSRRSSFWTWPPSPK